MNNLKFKSLATSYLSAILLTGATFTASCNSAAPPRSIGDSANSASTQRAQKPVPARDQQAIESASSVQITKLDGGAFKLSDFRGKVLVVDFWATYCPPCVRQVPQLAQLSKKYRDKGLEVIGLTSDERADQENVVKFLKDAGADYTVGYDNRWLSSAFLKGTENEDGTTPIPQLFVISREGRVVEHMVGESPQRGIEYLEQVVSQQLSSR
jgi:cytochrome c biogenesis protein CcmG/thiol:disulfide interchange protein DsbE